MELIVKTDPNFVSYLPTLPFLACVGRRQETYRVFVSHCDPQCKIQEGSPNLTDHVKIVIVVLKAF